MPDENDVNSISPSLTPKNFVARDEHLHIAAAGLSSDPEAEVKLLKNILIEAMERITELEKIGRVFHDFNNILSSSMGYASLASERAADIDDEKLSRYLGNIEKAGVRSRDLVRECLAQRQRFRDGQRCVLGEVFDRLRSRRSFVCEGGKNTTLESVELNIAMESAYLIVDTLLQAASSSAPTSVAGEVREEPVCSHCGHELRGLQLEFTIKNDHTASTGIKFQDQERHLVAVLAQASGGHFCESLVQDHEIVVYLKANASQLD